MEALKSYIRLELSYAAATDPENAKIHFDHAFGALEYHLWLHPEQEEMVNLYWDTVRPKFDAIIWGL